MRPVIAVGWALLAFTSTAGAERPVPQDAARMEKRASARLAWNRRTLKEDYDRVGKKSPRWDRPAGEALDLAARMFSQQFNPVVQAADVHAATKEAIEAGCDDPLVLYLDARTLPGPDFPNSQELDRRLQHAAEAMAASQYSPYRRATALSAASVLRARRPRLNQEGAAELERKLDAVLDLLPESLARDPKGDDWDNGWFRQIHEVIDAHRRIGRDFKAAFDRADARLANVAAIEPLRLAVRGRFLVDWGWEARTNQLAANVNEDQFRKFDERLREARAALTRSWELRPGMPAVAVTMLMVEKGIGQGDRKAMETWFERAMLADGNNVAACWQKLDWLDPKWYGGDSFEPMIDFGRACAATKNWHSGIALLVTDAHFRHWARLPKQERVAYMRSPEVWNDVRAAFLEHLEHFPDDAAARSKFAMICYLGAHYPMAHRQFEALGGQLTTWPGAPRMPLQRLQKAREHTATIMANRKQQPGA